MAWRMRRTARSMCARTSAYNVAYSTTCDWHRWYVHHCERTIWPQQTRCTVSTKATNGTACTSRCCTQKLRLQQITDNSLQRNSNGCVGRPDAARAAAVAWRGMAWQIVSVDSFHTALLSALSATSTSSRRTSALDLTALCCSAPTLRGQRQIFAAQTGATPHSTRGAHRTYGADISVLSDFTSTVPFEQGPAVVYQDSPYSSAASFQLVV